jgi:hypothetical protein
VSDRVNGASPSLCPPASRSPTSVSQIRAAHSLLSLSHTLKLLHLFADTATPTLAREQRAAQLEKEIAQAKERVESLVGS